MIPKDYWEAWALNLSGVRVQEDISEITRYHRIPGTKDYYSALEYVQKRFKEAGFDDQEMFEYPADGEYHSGMWVSQKVWQLHSGTLEIIEPEKSKGILANAEVNPITVTYRSFPTPPEGFEATVIDVGEAHTARDFTTQDVKDAVMLARPGLRVWTLGVMQHGAKGVIFGSRGISKIDDPDLVEWNAIPRYLLKDKKPVAFQVSERQYRILKDLAAKEKANNRKLRVRMTVSADDNTGIIPVFTTKIEGQKLPQEEIIIVAHLCHPKPSANDNASGVATTLEIARVWRQLIELKKLPAPIRTIRFMILPEWRGSIPWVQKEVVAKNRKVIAAFSLDMVGADQEKVGSTLIFDETPMTLPSFINDRMEAALARATKEPICGVGHPPTQFRWERIGFQGGSDHLPFVHPDANIPALCLTEWPDRYYHSSRDTVDKTNPVVIARTALAVTQVAMELSNADLKAAEIFRTTTAWAGHRRLLEFAEKRIEKAVQEIRGLKEPHRRQVGELWRDITLELSFRLETEEKAIQSTSSIVTKDHRAFEQQAGDLLWSLANLAQRLKDNIRVCIQREANAVGVDIRRLRTWTPRPDQWVTKAQTMIPSVNFKGPFSHDKFLESLDEKDLEWYQEMSDQDKIGWRFFGAVGQLCTWMDGKRSLLTIHQLQNHTILSLPLQQAVEFVNIMVKQGWITLK